jgi:hypothetical protein
MNDFYRGKASLPRQCRSGTLAERLSSWKEFRLLNVAKACDGIEDNFRKNFGRLHREYADSVDAILFSKGNEREMCEILLDDIRKRFKTGSLAMMPGWIKDASGLCGAELEKILSEE